MFPKPRFVPESSVTWSFSERKAIREMRRLSVLGLRGQQFPLQSPRNWNDLATDTDSASKSPWIDIGFNYWLGIVPPKIHSFSLFITIQLKQSQRERFRVAFDPKIKTFNSGALWVVISRHIASVTGTTPTPMQQRRRTDTQNCFINNWCAKRVLKIEWHVALFHLPVFSRGAGSVRVFRRNQLLDPCRLYDSTLKGT